MATKVTRGRPTKGAAPRDRSGALYVLLDPTMLAELDRWVASLNTGNLGPQWTRSDAVRTLIAKGLAEKAAKGEAP